MNLVINSIHFETSEQLKSFIQKKVSKLERYFDNIIKAEVFLKVIKPETSENKNVVLHLYVPNAELLAEKTADTFEEGVDLAVDALKKQMEKYKEKLRSA